MQPQSLKLTIKLKPEKPSDNPVTTVDHPNNVEGDQVANEVEKNHSTEDVENGKSQYQLVLYDPNIANRSIEIETVQVGPTRHRSRPLQFSNQVSSPAVGAFTVQCANCFKWRLIPTKEKYEVIREHIIEQPFVCETGREWRPNISCEDPPDMTQDGSRLWAIDKPNIAQSPPGWERLLRIRGEGSSKFADVYYVAPSGKRLRSMVEVQKFLNEHPEYVESGVSLSRFSFQTPKPLRENYVRKRPAHAVFANDADDNGTPGSTLPSEVQPIAWASPDAAKFEVDRLTNLPCHIIDKILSYSSLRDAVRTSVLSNKWRHKWVTLPHLVFDNQSVLISTQDQILVKSKLVNIVDHVLLLHAGPIDKFKLSHRDLQGVPDIDRWILFLSRGSVKEFILEIWKGHRYKLHSAIYTCQKLIHLELFNCLLKPPIDFNGFRSLKSLDLQHITMDQLAFENMVSSCPLLERLTLMNFEGFSLLNIHAPNLLFFDVGGKFGGVSFEDTFHLAVVSIGLYSTDLIDERNVVFGSAGNLTKFFACLPHIQRLEVQTFFLKYLAAGNIPAKLPMPCVDLSFLSIRINFNYTEENMAALCLLRSSPNLQELEMLVRGDEQAAVETTPNIVENFRSFQFNQLRVIKFVGVSGSRQELSFINFMLVNAHVLERMTVKPASNDSGWELMKELLRFRRASTFAEIVYIDPIEI